MLNNFIEIVSKCVGLEVPIPTPKFKEPTQYQIIYKKKFYKCYLQRYKKYEDNSLLRIFMLYYNSKMTFSQEYINCVSSTNVSIKTLNNGVPTIEVHPFISAKTKLTNALFHISTSDNGIDFNDKYAYELMVNLLTSYYLAF